MTELKAELERAARDSKYQRQIAEGLERALERARDLEKEEPALEWDIDSARIIIFSDHHKGARNHADDFRRCERAYNTALGYYLTKGFTLIELGDVEELWEERDRKVVKKYQYVLEKTAEFSRRKRYLRFWGNHDDLWSFPDRVKSRLGPIFGEDLKVYEARTVRILRQGRELGLLFLVHGHQGTTESDKFGWFSRIPVRFVWRPIQRVFKISLNTPAKEWVLREKHNIAMYLWAQGQSKTVLIAGHTHRPVFKSKTHAQQLEDRVEDARRALSADPTNEAFSDALAELTAEQEWVRSQGRGLGERGPEGEASVTMDRPSYFNTGCCCFVDGDVTGLEIRDGEIRLVRWPDDEDKPKPQYLARMPLEELFPDQDGK